MEISQTAPQDIDDYLSRFPGEIRGILEKIRATIRAAAPGAEEAISYGMPTFRLHGNLVHFAAFKHHIGFYSTPTGVEAFKEALSPYKSAKGSVQFPIDKLIPFDLITKIVEFRARENQEKATMKKKK